MGGTTVRSVVLAALALVLPACGEPLVVLGDWPGVLRVVAGTPDSFGENVDTLATRIRLAGPIDVETGPNGVLYVLDGRRVLSVTSAGLLRLVYDPATCLQFCIASPSAFTMESGGTLLIADPGANRIWRLDPRTRALTPFAGSGQAGAAPSPDGTQALAARIEAPGGIAVDAGGRVYFTETRRNILRRVEAGLISTLAGTGAAAFSGDNGPARQAALNGPGALAIAGTVLYVADVDNHRIRAVDLANGSIRTIAGTGTAQFGGDGDRAATASLNHPAGLAVADDGHTLFVSDSFNHRVRTINLDNGAIFTQAGTGNPAFTSDGLPGDETSLRLPAGLAVSPEGFLFIADTGHRVVWRTALRQ